MRDRAPSLRFLPFRITYPSERRDGTTRTATGTLADATPDAQETLRNVLTLLIWFGNRDLKHLESCSSMIATLTRNPLGTTDKDFERAYGELDRAQLAVREWMVNAETKVTNELSAADSILFRSHANIAVNRTCPDHLSGTTTDLWDDMAGRLQWLAERAERLSK